VVVITMTPAKKPVATLLVEDTPAG